MSRELLATEALAQILKLLTLMDRDPHSPTYGCDCNFWQYKIIDFPSGMAQEFVWLLALAAALGLLCTLWYLLPAIGALPFLDQYLSTIQNIRGSEK